MSLFSCSAELLLPQPDETIVFKEVDGIQLRAYVFKPTEQETGNLSGIAFFHGGGWAYGSADEFFAACRRFADRGMVAISFEYRLSRNEDGSVPNPYITPIESVKDARSAIRWMRTHASELGVDPDRIVVSGQSAERAIGALNGAVRWHG